MRKCVPGVVGGEPAELILQTVRSFPLSLDYAGRIVVHETAIGAAAERFRRAYERVELELLEREERCPDKASHRTLDALWLIKPGTSPLHSDEHLVLRSF
jgi:hypothetical protein